MKLYEFKRKKWLSADERQQMRDAFDEILAAAESGECFAVHALMMNDEQEPRSWAWVPDGLEPLLLWAQTSYIIGEYMAGLIEVEE